MTDMSKEIELLAPAGTHETFWAAIENGADAVYLGLKDLNARALARNFTLEEVADLTDAAHLKDRKVFVAMNSLMKEDEIPKAIDALSSLSLIGVDAIIIQDLGLWRLARTYFPNLRLHASTLMAIHNSFGVRMAKQMGFSRVVFAREMTLDEIRAGTACTGIETEVFVHGAMCFSYSGLCLFSSYFGGKSGLRGRCVQPCRRRYEWGGKAGAYFSMGDLSGLGAVDELRRIGVRSLKIEGRLRPPHYVASVVKAYRMVIDHPGDADTLSTAQELAHSALGRPDTKGYFKNASPKDAILPWRMANTGVFIGRVLDYKGDRLLVDARLRLEQGDRLRIVYQDRESQQSFLCAGLDEARDGKVWIKTNTSLKDTKGALIFRADIARDAALHNLSVKRHDAADKTSFKALLKKARLNAQEVIRKLPGENTIPARDNKAKNRRAPANIWVRISDPRALSLVRGFKIKGIILSITPQNLRLLKGKTPAWLNNMAIIWSLPAIIPEDQATFYKDAVKRLTGQGFDNFEAANLGAINLLKEVFPGKGVRRNGRRLIFGSYTLNLLNSQALAGARGLGVDMPQFSIETDKENARRAMLCAPSVQTAFTIFSYLPVITSRMDLNAFSQRGPITSPKGERFYWHREAAGNVGVLLPDKPFSLINRQAELKDAGFYDWIIDLSHWIKSKHTPRGAAEGRSLSHIPAKAFNFFDGLE
jgi:putative protease